MTDKTDSKTPLTEACDVAAAKRDYNYRWQNYRDLCCSLELRLLAAESRSAKLELAIQQVLDDEESRPGAWGPDVTCVGILQQALK